MAKRSRKKTTKSRVDYKKIHIKKRSEFTKQKRSVLRSLSAKRLTEGNKKKLERKLKSLEGRIEKQNAKLFKYTKEHIELVRRKRDFINKINGIKRVLKGKRGRAMSEGERNRLLKDIGVYNEALRHVNTAISKEAYVEPKGRRISFVGDAEGEKSTEVITIWELRDKVERLIGTNAYRFIIIEGEKYSLEINKVMAMWALDDLVVSIMDKQRQSNYKTPMVEVEENRGKKTITLRE